MGALDDFMKEMFEKMQASDMSDESRMETKRQINKDLSLPEDFELEEAIKQYLSQIIKLSIENDLRSGLAKDIGQLIDTDPAMKAVALMKLADVAIECMKAATSKYSE